MRYSNHMKLRITHSGIRNPEDTKPLLRPEHPPTSRSELLGRRQQIQGHVVRPTPLPQANQEFDLNRKFFCETYTWEAVRRDVQSAILGFSKDQQMPEDLASRIRNYATIFARKPEEETKDNLMFFAQAEFERPITKSLLQSHSMKEVASNWKEPNNKELEMMQEAIGQSLGFNSPDKAVELVLRDAPNSDCFEPTPDTKIADKIIVSNDILKDDFKTAFERLLVLNLNCKLYDNGEAFNKDMITNAHNLAEGDGINRGYKPSVILHALACVNMAFNEVYQEKGSAQLCNIFVGDAAHYIAKDVATAFSITANQSNLPDK